MIFTKQTHLTFIKDIAEEDMSSASNHSNMFFTGYSKQQFCWAIHYVKGEILELLFEILWYLVTLLFQGLL